MKKLMDLKKEGKEIIDALPTGNHWNEGKSNDLYFWIEILDHLDDKLADPELPKEQILKILQFSASLLERSNSRAIYNSCDRMASILLSDDPELVLGALDVLIATVKITHFNGKPTSAHQDKDLIRRLSPLADGFSLLKDVLSGSHDVKFSELLASADQGIPEANSLQFKSSHREELNTVEVDLLVGDSSLKTVDRVRALIDEKSLLEDDFEEMWAKLWFYEASKTKEGLELMTQVQLRAACLYCQLVVCPMSETTLGRKYVRRHPMKHHIADLFKTLTVGNNPDIHSEILRLLYAYLCCSQIDTLGPEVSPFQPTLQIVLSEIGLPIADNQVIHKILRDFCSIKRSEDDPHRIVCDSKFLPPETAQCTRFQDFLFKVIFQLTQKVQIKNANYHQLIKQLLHLIEMGPEDGKFLLCHKIGSKAGRILINVIKSNFSNYRAVEKIISRVTSELALLNTPVEQLKLALDPEDHVSNTERRELIRVLFRLLNHSIFKNDPQAASFNPNYVPNSRKIIDSELFEHCLRLVEEANTDNQDTHSVVVQSTVHLLAVILNDLPAQIPKLITSGLIPQLLTNLERHIPKHSNYYYSILKFVIAVRIHEKGKECIRNSKIVERMFSIICESGYAEAFVHADRVFEYNRLFNDFLRDDETLQDRAAEQLIRNADTISEKFKSLFQKFKETKDIGQAVDFLDAVEGHFTLTYHLYTSETRDRGDVLNQNFAQKFLTQRYLEAMFEGFLKYPLASALMLTDSSNVYYNVLRKICHDNQAAVKLLIKATLESLTSIEQIIGGFGRTFRPEKNEEPTLKDVTPENVGSLDHFNTEEKLKYLFAHVTHGLQILQSTASKSIDMVMSSEGMPEIIEKVGQMKLSVLHGGVPTYLNKLKRERAEYQLHILDYDERAYNEEDISLPEVDGFSMELYNKRYIPVESLNYNKTIFSGVLEVPESEIEEIERAADACEMEIQNFIDQLWKRSIGQESSHPAVMKLLDAMILSCNVFNEEELKSIVDVDNWDPESFNEEDFMSRLVVANQVVEEFSKVFGSEKESPYIIEFYNKGGFDNFFALYHWMRKLNPLLEELPPTKKRIFLAKHLQLVWSNLGDFFALVIESRFVKSGNEKFGKIEMKHKDQKTFFWCLYYHICKEIMKQENIVQFFKKHSTFFLECLLDIVKFASQSFQHN